MDNYKVILSEETIQKRIKELGEEITRDYQGKEPVVICMLKGAVYFFADLTKSIKLPLMLDFARLSAVDLDLQAQLDEEMAAVRKTRQAKAVENIKPEDIDAL